MTTRDNADDAEFVIFGGRLADGSVGYANHNGNLVSLTRAETWDYRRAIAQARDLSQSLKRGLWVAPLLFGIADVESLTWVPLESV